MVNHELFKTNHSDCEEMTLANESTGRWRSSVWVGGVIRAFGMWWRSADEAGTEIDWRDGGKGGWGISFVFSYKDTGERL